jgi:hypothetical protein
MSHARLLLAGVSLVAVGTFIGCGTSTNTATPSATPATPVASTGHSHDGWWCPEHGVPEEVCALCDASLVAGFKEKGDWCDEHDRPDSQCFICHPEKQAEFAALYEAKYGEQPPPLSAEGDDHADHDHADHEHEHADDEHREHEHDRAEGDHAAGDGEEDGSSAHADEGGSAED